MTAHERALNFCKVEFDANENPYVFIDRHGDDYGVGIIGNSGPSRELRDYAFVIQAEINWGLYPPPLGDPDGPYYQAFLKLVAVDQPTAAEPSKIDDQWKMYSQQLRGELTATQQELADQKAAYNGLCEAHKELVDRLADPRAPGFLELAQSINRKNHGGQVPE